MKIWTAILAGSLAMGTTAGGALPARAQAAYPDVPENHWAYDAVKSLADKGYVKGYPDGKFLGKRALSRYEFATVIDRMAQTVSDLSAKIAAGTAPTTPTGAPVTQDDLNKIQSLTDSFRTQLDAIQAVTAGASSPFQDQIDALRQDVLDTKELAGRAQDTANASYGFGANRKFSISGYVQARVNSADSGDKTRFPEGSPANTGAGQVNGNYAQGGNKQSLVLRRSRIKLSGGVTANTRYTVQIDASGFASGSPSATNQQVTVREGNVAYTFGDGSSRFPTMTFGLFNNPFGYQLPLSSSSLLSPERPLAFNEGNSGLWTSQDYDRGAQIAYGTGPYRFIAALVNGTGLASNDIDRRVDQIYRAAYQSQDKQFGAGVSYYNGQLPGTGTGTGYKAGKKELYGVDAQFVSPRGPFLMAEYLGGTYERRAFFDTNAATTPLIVNPAPGNKVEGYYVQGGYTLTPAGSHPLTLGASYDKFRRSKSGVGAVAVGGASGSNFDDINFGYGVLYGLDRQTRFRLWYNRPYKLSAGTNDPPKIGLFTGELQVKF